MEPPKLSEPPVEFIVPCSNPSSLPNKSLTQLEVETFWIEDRKQLLICGERHKALQEFYHNRDELVKGNRIK